MRLEGKSAIVTGAASGIGFATAALFVAEGANVIAADLGMPELEGTIGVAADAGDEAAVTALVDRAQKEFGGLDIFFANAGVSGGLASIFEQSPEDWQEILRVNLAGGTHHNDLPVLSLGKLPQQVIIQPLVHHPEVPEERFF